MGNCVSSNLENRAVYKRLINEIFSIVQILEQKGEKQKTGSNANKYILDDTQKKEFENNIRKIDGHVKQSCKALRDHLSDNQHRLTEAVDYMKQKLKQREGDVYYQFIVIKVLDFLSQNMNRFTRNFKVRRTLVEDENSRVDHNSSIGHVSNLQSTRQEEIDILFLSDNFIQFENNYLLIFSEIIRNDFIVKYVIESMQRFGKNRKTPFQSDGVYPILKKLEDIMKDRYLNIKTKFEKNQNKQQDLGKQNDNGGGAIVNSNNKEFEIQKNQSMVELKMILETMYYTLKNLPQGALFFKYLKEAQMENLLDIVIIMNREEKQNSMGKQNSVQSKDNTNNIELTDANTAVLDQTNRTERQDSVSIQQQIINQCHGIIGVYTQRAFNQKSYGKLVNPLLRIFDKFLWNDLLDIEKIIEDTLKIAVQEQVQLNYEVYLLGKLIGYISYGTQEIEQISQRQIQDDEKQEIFQNNHKPYIKIRSLRLLSKLIISKEKNEQYLLYFQMDKILDAIIFTITYVQECKIIPGAPKPQESDYVLYKNSSVMQQVKSTFNELVSSLSKESKSIIDVIAYLAQTIQSNYIEDSLINKNEDLKEQISIIADLLDICIDKMKYCTQSNAIKDEIIVNFILISRCSQFRKTSFEFLQKIITTPINQKQIYRGSNGIYSNKQNHEELEQYFIMYDNSLKFIFGQFIHYLNKACRNSNNTKQIDQQEQNQLVELGWSILLILTNILLREDCFSCRHLQFLIISFAIYLVQEIQFKYGNFIILKKICLTLLARIAHTKINNLAIEQEKKQSSPQKNGNNNNRLSSSSESSYLVIEQFKDFYPVLDKTQYLNFVTQNNDNNSLIQKQECQLQNLLDNFILIDKQNVCYINQQQFAMSIQNFDQEFREWVEKVKGEAINEIADDIIAQSNFNSQGMMMRSGNRRDSIRNSKINKAGVGTASPKNTEKYKDDISFQEVCNMMVQKKNKKKMTDLNEIDIQF